MLRKTVAAAGVAAAALLAANSASALNITLNDTGGVAVGSQAYAGFRAAADFWEAVLLDNINVGLNVGFSSTGFSSPNIIGQTSSLLLTGPGLSVTNVYALLGADASTALDGVSVANQQQLTNGALAVITQQSNPGGTGVLQNIRVAGVETVSNREFDNDGSINNSFLRVNTANAKALGLDLSGVMGYAGIDANVTFNSAFAFDFDPTNGIALGMTDFIGTAIHEIGHALGFTSGVDVYDNNTNFSGNYDTFPRATALDLFRFSDNPTGLGGGGVMLDWSVGNAPGGRPFFSFDGGQSRGLSSYGGDEGFFSTGAVNGDGRQASHFQDTPYVPDPSRPGCNTPVVSPRGILDPTFARCELGVITSLDLAAFDAIGWDLSYNVLQQVDRTFTSANAFTGNIPVPEPSTWATMVIGFGLLGGTLRAARRQAVRVRA